VAGEHQVPSVEGVFEQRGELTPKDDAESLDVEEKALSTGYPPCSVWRQDATGDDAVDMEMGSESLVPGMEDGREAHFSSEVVVAELLEGLRHRLKQELEDHVFVTEREGVKFVRECEHIVEVRDREKLGGARLEPFGFGEGLALGTMAIATGVVGRSLKTAIITLFEMASQKGRATGLDGLHHFEMGNRERMVPAVGVAVEAEYVCHLPTGPTAPGFRSRGGECLRLTGRSGPLAAR